MKKVSLSLCLLVIMVLMSAGLAVAAVQSLDLTQGHGSYVANVSGQLQLVDSWSIKKIVGGGTHTLLLDTDGNVYAFGGNVSGQLGTGDYNPRLFPTKLTSLSNVVDIAAGSDHSAAVTADGSVYAWGKNSSYQLGMGDITTRVTPTQVPGLSGCKLVAAGALFTVALKSDGTPTGWQLWEMGVSSYGTSTTAWRITSVTGSPIAVSANGANSILIMNGGKAVVNSANLSYESGTCDYGNTNHNYSLNWKVPAVCSMDQSGVIGIAAGN